MRIAIEATKHGCWCGLNQSFFQQSSEHFRKTELFSFLFYSSLQLTSNTCFICFGILPMLCALSKGLFVSSVSLYQATTSFLNNGHCFSNINTSISICFYLNIAIKSDTIDSLSDKRYLLIHNDTSRFQQLS